MKSILGRSLTRSSTWSALACITLLGTPAAISAAPTQRAEAPAHRTQEVMDRQLVAALVSSVRTSADRARDRDRHPYATLRFGGLRPGLIVIDLQPEGGYWTRILAPYLAQTHGIYIAGVPNPGNLDARDLLVTGDGEVSATKAGRARLGPIQYTAFGPASPALGAPGRADLIIASREVHNWINVGYADKGFGDAFRALKPGGILAIEEHRAEPQIDPVLTGYPFTGYVPTPTVIALARKVGFVLEATSEINANPRDVKSYPFGVWTLPPSQLSSGPGFPSLTDAQRARFNAIGESDRMTLRFRKPFHSTSGARRAPTNAIR
ncbi:class I SAM-dependent methyltransferase [Sphingobium yanoikuyae]|nr:class I SAM-dependent methyltransferase [Sphingobium yanoikuyae]